VTRTTVAPSPRARVAETGAQQDEQRGEPAMLTIDVASGKPQIAER
jgi:hypothetical protein